ncbi:cupin domain-containing protein [Myxococcus sp. K15C18031901]|uniref:cupin domain-containing protein n=1 Tax=Myxococcus dinghuensis TaxID=2906761 RepID=UPI0020A7CF9A|nr:cupin domain-containing protein [Myxococcus dinghuensis]MCP3101659.1 cupin domain-containing protein [Myxococcus dinghuensis]
MMAMDDRDAGPRGGETVRVEALGFESLLAPLTPEVFFREHWEQRPLVTRGRARDCFAPLFSIRDVDRVIRYQKPGPGRLDLVTAGGFVRDNFLNLDNTANINLVYENYLKGSTLVLSGLEETWEPLEVFCRKLEGQLSHPVAVAVYLTPPGHHGVQPHFDTQENFILQVEGVKHWKVYGAGQALPRVEGSYTPVARERLPELLLETDLHPGDMLYVPRGFVHEAEAREQASLHITVDVHVRTWRDFLEDALAAMAERDPRFRRSLPPGLLRDPGAVTSLEAGFRELVASFHRDVRVSDALAKHAEKLIVARPPPPDGHFAMLHADIGLDTPLKKRTAVLTRRFQEAAVAGIQFSGNQLLGPAKIAEALRYIDETDRVVASRLPGGLGDNEKLVLVRRLVRVGLLTHASEE